MKKIVVTFACFTLLSALSQASLAEKILSGEEIKALITDKTVYVTRSSSIKWRQYFAPDGSSSRDNGETSEWSVEDNEHCNTAAKVRCAQIRDNEDGTYSRVRSNGDTLVTWTKIVDGQEF